MKIFELKSLFANFPSSIGLGYRGRNGTVFTLKEPLRVKEDDTLIKEVETSLMSLSVAKRKAAEMKKHRQKLFCLPAFRSGSESSELVYGFTFRDMNEIVD